MIHEAVPPAIAPERKKIGENPPPAYASEELLLALLKKLSLNSS